MPTCGSSQPAIKPPTTAFDHHTGKPASDGTDNQPNDECLYVHFFPRFLLARKGLVPSQLLYSRFFDRPGRREATCVTKTSLSTLFRYVRVIGAFYPDMIREEIKDSMAERGFR